MTSPRQKILFFSTFTAPFMEIDRQILSRFSDVVEMRVRGIVGALRLGWSTLFVDGVLSWFASTYTAVPVFMARLLGKRSVVIVGGADVSVQKELGYGLLTARWKRCLIRYSLRRATAVVPVSLHLETLTRNVGKYDGHNLHRIPPGLDDRFWKRKTPKEPTVITVAGCPTPERVRIKGIDVLMEAARLIPDVSIHIVGVDDAVLKSMDIPVPPNVSVRPWLSEEELLKLYGQSRICCQPSRIESFSFALAQGMLCECIPVASRVGGMPEVVGETGFLVRPGDPDSLAAGVTRAFQADRGLGRAARERIQSHFSLQRRSAGLKKLFEE